MQELIGAVGQLSAKERKALAAMLRQKGINLFGIAPVFKRKPDQPLLLSYAQERQWFLWQLDPHSAAYHLSSALMLEGRLDVDALERSFDTLVQRHETLRTRFVEQDGQTLQVIDAHRPFALQRATLPAPLDDAAIRDWVEAQSRCLFDLSQAPLMRVALLDIGEQRQVLVITQHHIVSDGWSMQIMVDELMQLYAGQVQGMPAQLPVLPIQYADYALWQREWMEAGERERQLNYWTARLGGEQPVLELPLDHPRPAVQSFDGAVLGIHLPPPLGQALKQLAQAENVTLFMLLLATFQTLLHRYSGQDDIRVGVPVANRNRVETEGLLGFFVNTQILKADVDGQQGFRTLLAQVRQSVLDAQDHQDLPFEQLVDALQPERTLSHNALFQVMYSHQGREESGWGERQLPGLALRTLDWSTGNAQFDLTLTTYEREDGLDASLTYATDLFEPQTAERLGRHWLNLLQAIVADPSQRIGELPMLDDEERLITLGQWNGSVVSHPSQGTLHGLIERQVERSPQAIAISHAGTSLSYETLNRRANRLAHRLIEAGVGADVRVGLAVERGPDMLVGLLAILKAGGAYVPLDPSYPADRLAYMIEDSGIALLLAQPTLLTRLPVADDLACEALGEDAGAGYPEHNPGVALDAGNLAYVIYTSGSTGKPKGTLLAHHNVVRLFAATEHWFGFDESDVWTLFHSYAFDFSVWEIFGALLYGGRLVIVPHDTSRSPDAFFDLLVDEQVTVLNQTPSAFSPLMQVACAPAQVPAQLALRHVVFGGEALDVKSLKPWLERFGDRQPRLINMYGITEITVHVTYRPITLADLDGEVGSPIGEVIPDLSWYLLDPSLNPVARGCIGELYIGQAGLARGYLNRGDLTATRFIPDPFGTAGERLYRTGDLARYSADGVIEYIGRIDHQVKIRGFRIELGEIEARLAALPEVSQAVVLAQQAASGAQLVGYVVVQAAGGDTSVVRDTLRRQLREQLPEHMVPAHLMVLDALPLTVNGKLDRRALPQPDASLLQGAYVAPGTELEQRIADLWRDVLKLERVGLTDNFFELGGDSIMSIQMVSRARQAGIRFSPKDLFQHQTVQRLARVAEQGEQTLDEQALALSGPVPLLPMQQLFFDTDIPQRHHWNQSVLLRPARRLDGEYLEAALDAVVAGHDALRLRFVEQDGTWQASISEQASRNLLWQRSCASLEALDQLGEQAQASLDLAGGELLRALLVDLPGGEQRLLLVIHHLAVDGVSWRILFEDLQQAYTALAAQQPVQLPARTHSVKWWAERLQQKADEMAAAQLDYWRGQLEGLSPTLPCDNPGGRLQGDLEQHVSTRLDADTTRALLQEAPAAYRTQVNDLLLAALARVLARWTGHDAVGVLLEGHGREELVEDQDLSRTVGWFTSLFPVRLTALDALGDTLCGVKEQLRAIPDKGIGYGALRYLGNDDARATLAALPLPRVTFNYLGQFDASFDDVGALFTPCGDAAGNPRSGQAPLDNWLSINGQVFKGALELNWTFSGEMFDTATVQRLADDYAEQLRLVIAHCCTQAKGHATPSDFPLAGLDQTQLDALAHQGLELSAVEDLYPLAPMQQGMLFHSLYARDAGDYITQMSLPVTGLDPQRFIAAWQAAVDAHAILRTAFLWQPPLAQPRQAVMRHVEVPWQLLDWRGRQNQSGALVALADGERALGFDLSCAPLLRLVLVRLDEQRYQMIYTHHHILMDGWSNSQLMGEVLQRYCGQAPVGVPGRYADYIGWLQAQDAGRSEAFWRDQVSAFDEPTLLAQAASGDGSGHASLHLELDARDTERLQVFAKACKVTVNTVLQASWLLLLQRYTGQPTVAFGATVAGRPADLRDAEQQIGLFINTLPVIAQPRADLTLGQWLQQVQVQNLGLREFEHTPLFDVQRWAGRAGEALFDTILVFENYPVAEVLQRSAPEGLSFGELEQHEQTNYPLTLSVGMGERLSLHFSHDRAHFGAADMARIGEQLLHLLESLPDAADCRLDHLSLFDEVQRQATLAEWNPAPQRFDSAQCLHQLIEAQATRVPDAIAVSLDGQQLSYAQLNARANQLARALVEQGIGAETLVGLAVERGLEMIVGLLAILKAGGAYVPLDPAYPQDRLAYMIEDSGLQSVLTQQ
ncbi:amino acid adenylation domain-containing protein, partial [Pseudomonas alabamensis]|uniref:amino acid adenylation domain-containing protein n=1 Tax=Pseudomonas alabamensis TaxID=3064349 RepID=UPI003F64A9EE